MKKSIALVALAFGVTGAFAQDLTSKKGEPILPEAGDWGLAIDATPFLNYAGNFFGKSGGTTPGSGNNVAPSWGFFTTAQTITGKYFVDAQTAYRGSVRIGLNSNSTRNMVADRGALSTSTGSAAVYPTAKPMKENVWKHSNTVIGLAAGIEKRKGKTRLQGYYGGEVGIYANMSKDKFTYGNALNTSTVGGVVVDPTDDAFAGSGNIVTSPAIQSFPVVTNARATEIKNGTIFSFGVRGFIGAEYFILPKMSLGGEFGWGLGLSMTGKTKTTLESIGTSGAAGSTSQVGTTTIEGSKNGGFSLDTDGKNSVWGPTGALRLNLYF